MNVIQLVWDRRLSRPIGTSFSFLRPDWVATAKHVVIEDDLPRPSLTVQFSKGVASPAEVIAVHPEIDVAILRLTDSTPVTTPLFPAYHRFAGYRGLVACGYKPSLNDSENRNYRIQVNKVDSFKIEGRTRAISKEEVIVFPSPGIECGHSGGPLLGEGGSVVGLVIQIFQDDGKPFARGTSILSLLDGLEFTNAWSPVPEPLPSPTPVE